MGIFMIYFNCFILFFIVNFGVFFVSGIYKKEACLYDNVFPNSQSVYTNLDNYNFISPYINKNDIHFYIDSFSFDTSGSRSGYVPNLRFDVLVNNVKIVSNYALPLDGSGYINNINPYDLFAGSLNDPFNIKIDFINASQALNNFNPKSFFNKQCIKK
jgi:hypothetical protein